MEPSLSVTNIRTVNFVILVQNDTEVVHCLADLCFYSKTGF